MFEPGQNSIVNETSQVNSYKKTTDLLEGKAHSFLTKDVEMTGSTTLAIILYRYRYLIEHNKTSENEYYLHDGKYWTCDKNYDVVAKFLPGISSSTVKKSMIKLVNLGIMQKMQKEDTDRRNWFTFTDKYYFENEKPDEITQETKMVPWKRPKGSLARDQNGPMEETKMVPSTFINKELNKELNGENKETPPPSSDDTIYKDKDNPGQEIVDHWNSKDNLKSTDTLLGDDSLHAPMTASKAMTHLKLTVNQIKTAIDNLNKAISMPGIPKQFIPKSDFRHYFKLSFGELKIRDFCEDVFDLTRYEQYDRKAEQKDQETEREYKFDPILSQNLIEAAESARERKSRERRY